MMLGEVLAALAEVLDGAGATWYVFGAQAAVLYGVPRLTADVDATVNVALDRAGELAGLLGREGFELRVPDFESFVRSTRVLPTVHAPTGVPVDLVFAGAGLEQAFLRRARRFEVEGVSVPVISPDDLIVTKVLAGRPKDLEDVRAVLARQGGALDVDRVRDLLGQLDAALDRSDLLASFDGLAQEARRLGNDQETEGGFPWSSA